MDQLVEAHAPPVVTAAVETRLAGAAQLSAGCHLSLVSNVQGLAALETGWLALEQNAVTPTSVFQTYDWVSSWSKVFAARDNEAEVFVLTGFDGDRLVFVWPLMRHRVMGLWLLSWLSEPFGQYGDVIVAQAQCPRLWVANALRFLRQLKGFDILRLRHVRADSTLATIAQHELTDARLHERAPWLDLTAFATEADYENRYSSTQRKRRKKIRKALEEMGPVSFTILPNGTVADAAITQAFAEKNKWLAERGRMNRVLGHADHVQFLRQLARSKPDGLEMIVSELKAGDTPVSWEIGFRFGATHFAYITSHVNALTDLSPGRLHMDQSQRACLAAGMKAFDLMVPYDAHKESWSSACMDTRDYFMPFTPLGQLVGHVYLRLLRPAMRNLYYRMPAHLLRLVNRGSKATAN